MTEKHLWYLRRDEQIQGPFPSELVRRYILLGRVQVDDELSIDRKDWKRLAALPELMPDGTDETGERLAAARRWEDERNGEDRRRSELEGHPPRKGERRKPEPADVIVNRRERYGKRLVRRREAKEGYLGRSIIVAVFIVGLFVLAFLFPDEFPEDMSECDAAPRANVNWSNCRMEGAVLKGVNLAGAKLRNAVFIGADLQRANLNGSDLAYANLNIANLRFSGLRETNMVGTSLRNADLTGADLAEADLSYAILTGATMDRVNLRGAKLDNALWTDQRICRPGSVGRCVTEIPDN